MKLTLKNFQSHKESVLDIQPFTVIVGHSSSGKTAIVRAFKTLLYNIPSKSFIRHGAKSLEIELELDDGNKIKYLRDSSTGYSINGGPELRAIGRDQLQQIADLGFQPIEVDKKKYYVNISQQWDSPFLVSFSDSEVSKLLSSLSQAGKVKSAKSRIAKDSSEMASTLSIRQIDREAIQTKLVDLGDPEGLNSRLQSILESRSQIEKLSKDLSRVEELIESNRQYKLTPLPSRPENPSKLIILSEYCQLTPLPSRPENPSKLIILSEYCQLTPDYKRPEDPSRLIKLLEAVGSRVVQDIPDTSKLMRALELMADLEKYRVLIKNVQYDDVSVIKKEYLELQHKIHDLSSTCTECGQVLPEQTQKSIENV